MSAILQTAPASHLRADALAGVRTRRVFAFCVDIIVVSLLSFFLWFALGLVTLGLAWFVLPPMFPLVAFFYSGFSVSGRNMGTPGMRLFDLEVRMAENGARAPFINAAAQALLFYVSWCFPPVFLVTLFDAEKRFLHDILAQVVFVRRL
jgi:uncharacterized RDD family membrane protein YckC